jgi:hypothetical protein
MGTAIEERDVTCKFGKRVHRKAKGCGARSQSELAVCDGQDR